MTPVYYGERKGIMRKSYVVSVVLVTTFAFGALAAARAGAAEFLLAEWLVSGLGVITELKVESGVELLLEDPSNGLAVLCSALFVGWVGPNSLEFISEVLTLAGGVGSSLECVAQKGCESSPSPLLTFVNLSEIEVELMIEGTEIFFVSLFLPHSGGGNPGWKMECTVLDRKTIYECSAPEIVAELKLEEATKLFWAFSEAFTLLATGKGVTCVKEFTEVVLNLEAQGGIKLVEGGELTASSEGVVS
jgi:hypothetical protein